MCESKDSITDIQEQIGGKDNNTNQSIDEMVKICETEMLSEESKGSEDDINNIINPVIISNDNNQESNSQNNNSISVQTNQILECDLVLNSEFNKLHNSIAQIENEIANISDNSLKTSYEMREIHKLYHNEFANRLLSMQEELERYREIEKGRYYDEILSDVAKLYTDNESLLEEMLDEKVKKKIKYLFLDIEQILTSKGVSKHKSVLGDKRNTKYCKVVKLIPTDNAILNDTVFKSINTGFYLDNRPLVKELVCIYSYDVDSTNNSIENREEQ